MSATSDRHPLAPLQIEPIGIIRTPYVDKYDAPRQPGAEGAEDEVVGVIELVPRRNFEQALEDLSGFERVWIVSWFDRNTDWKPKVLPPRGGRTKRGVFATRSPHRPNPIGISVCRLLGVEGLRVRVANPDLLDRTPILDLKPYIPYADAFPQSSAGWLDSSGAAAAEGYTVEIAPLALKQDAWLAAEGQSSILERAVRILRRDPLPHPYRRTSQRPDGTCAFAYKAWRIVYRLEGRHVTIGGIESGYDHMNTRSDEKKAAPADAALHMRFMRARFEK